MERDCVCVCVCVCVRVRACVCVCARAKETDRIKLAVCSHSVLQSDTENSL